MLLKRFTGLYLFAVEGIQMKMFYTKTTLNLFKIFTS